MIDTVINHLRNRDYMSGVERDSQRVKATGEVFTPTPLVREILNRLPLDKFTDPTKTFIDNSCGDGQFLSEVIIKKMEHGSNYVQSLSTTYGVDLMPDNCLECIKRLYMADVSQIRSYNADSVAEQDTDYIWSPGLKHVYWVETEHYRGWANVVCADGLKYDYKFGNKPQRKVEVFGNGLFTIVS